jgi:hypothetical protein
MRTGEQQFSVGSKKSRFSGRAAAPARVYVSRKVGGGSLTSSLAFSDQLADPANTYPKVSAEFRVVEYRQYLTYYIKSTPTRSTSSTGQYLHK